MQYTSTTLRRHLMIEEIIMVHFFEYSSDLNFSGESHDFWEFVYVVSGCVEIYADNNHHILHKGEVLFHQPNEFHTLRSYEGTCPSLIIISFISHDEVMEHFRHVQLEVTDEKILLLRKILTETQASFSTPLHIPLQHAYLSRRETAPFGGEQLIALYLEEFLISLLRDQFRHPIPNHKDFFLKLNIPHSSNIYVNETLEFFVQNISRKLSLVEICSSIGIGRARLQQLFHNEFGCGVIEYFSYLKVYAAKQLLRLPTSNISDIAMFLGFTSTSYFSSFFKKQFGCTPTQYKKTSLDITKNVKALPPTDAPQEKKSLEIKTPFTQDKRALEDSNPRPFGP